MSSVNVTAIDAHNQKVLEDLAWAIEADAEAKEFALHFLECDYVSLREQKMEQLQALCEIPLTSFIVTSDATNLYTGIQAQMTQEVPQALMIIGLESVTNLEKLLQATNFAREEFRKNCPFPVIIWVNREISQKLASLARDFQNWAAAPTKLLMPPAYLIAELERKIELLIEGIGIWGSLKFLPTEEILGANYRFEAEAALQDLENQQYELTPNIKATLDFVEGRRLYANFIREGGRVNHQPESNTETDVELLTKAIELFHRSLELWQEVGETALLKCAMVHYHLALCYCHTQTSTTARSNSEEAIHHLQDCLALSQQAQRQDIVARFSNALGEIYQQQQLWQDLEQLTVQYLPWHQQEIAGQKPELESDKSSKTVSSSDEKRKQDASFPLQTEIFPHSPFPIPLSWDHLPYLDQILLAQDYSFLAQIAWKQKQDYSQALEQIQLALDTISQIPKELQIYHGHYWLLLAQIQETIAQALEDTKARQQQHKIALESQKQAIAIGAGDKPQLFLDWLQQLHNTYFDYKYYIDAYKTKLEIRSLQQQYGLIAFIGPGRIRAIQPGTRTAKHRLAQEIAASGRQHDVKNLISKIESTTDKLIIVYGQSGVGKSSLMEGGLVPALEQKGYLHNRDLIPVHLRVYTNWILELAQLLGLENPKSLASSKEEKDPSKTLTSNTSSVPPLIRDQSQSNERIVSTNTQSSQGTTEGELKRAREEQSQSQESITSTHTQSSQGTTEGEYPSKSLLERGTSPVSPISSDRVQTSPEPSQNKASSPPSPPTLGGTRIQSPPNLGDLGGKHLRNETQKTDANTVAFSQEAKENQSQPQKSIYELTERILKKLKDNAHNNCLTVLIFDQFEEFFFVSTQQEQRLEFFSFLAKCLEIRFVNVILSLREDYLHLLLEGSRLVELTAIGNDILKKDNLYYIGNFSPDEAFNVIQQLTQRARFFLETALIQRLVADLAGYQISAEDSSKFPTPVPESISTSATNQFDKLAPTPLNLTPSPSQAHPQSLSTSPPAPLNLTPSPSPSQGEGSWERGVSPKTTTRLAATSPSVPKEYRYQVRPIELQIVGAQMQALQIRTLKQYLALAKSEKTAKEVLVESYLVQVIKDCGETNQQVAELVLYLLTDETNKTRPLKTKQELATEISLLAEQGEDTQAKLNLVLQIFSLSGLVFVIPDFPAEHYQLVHDYLVGVILQKQGKSLLKQLQQAEAERKKAEQEREQEREARLQVLQERDQEKESRLRLFKRAIGGLILGILILLGLTGLAVYFGFKNKRQSEIAKAGQMVAKAEWLRNQRADLHEESLLLAVTAMKRFQKVKLRDVDADVAVRNGLKLLPNFVRELNHQGEVFHVAWSFDGKYLATASRDGTARVIEVVTGKKITRFDHQNEVYKVAWSSDDKYLATASRDGTARVIEVATGKEITLVDHQGEVYHVAWSPDGKYLATASRDGTARVIEVATEKQITRVDHEKELYDVAWSSDGKYLATASMDKTARVIEVATGKKITEVKHTKEVYHVAWSFDDKYLATASWDGTARVIEVATGKEITRVNHQEKVYHVAWSFDDKYLATASRDGTARVIEVATGKEITRVDHKEDGFNVAWSPDNKYLATASRDGTARVIEVATKKEITRVDHERVVYDVAWSPDGKYLATASRDMTAQVIEVATGKEITRVDHERFVYDVAWSPDDKYLVTASRDGTVRVIEVATEKEIIRVDHQEEVYHVAWSSDDKYLATASRDGTVRVIEVATEKEITRVGHQGEVHHVAWSFDGKYLATASWDGIARVIEVATEKEITRVDYHERVYHVAWSSDDKYLATASRDGTVRVIEVATKKEITRVNHEQDGSHVAWSPDDKYLATASRDGTARVIEVATGKEITRVGHQREVHHVAWSSDGKYLATASGDRTARVIEVATGKEITRIDNQGEVHHVAWSSDDKYLATTSMDKRARVHWFFPDDLIKEACRRLLRNLSASKWQTYVDANLSNYELTCSQRPPHPSLLSVAAKLIRNDQVKKARAILQRVQTLEAKRMEKYPELEIKPLDLNPETKEIEQDVELVIRQITAPIKVEEGVRLAREGKVEQAIALFQEAQKLKPDIDLNPNTEAIDKDPKIITDNLAAPSKVKAGWTLAREGKVEEAIALFQEAQKLKPGIDLNPETEVIDKDPKTIAYHLAALSKVEEGWILAREGKVEEAIALFQEAQQLDPKLEKDASIQNELCRFGSLNGYAHKVMFACEKAVALDPKNGGFIDSRGLARALTGDRQGAIADFQAFVQWTNNNRKKAQRQSWIDALKRGEDPFTPEELEKLKN